MSKKRLKKRTVYNIVDSVKGGCGKTTFSIMLGLSLYEKRRLAMVADTGSSRSAESINPNTCLVDVDIQGTAMQYLLFGKNYILPEGTIYLNDRITEFEETGKTFTNHLQWGNLKLDVVLSSPEQKVKNRYRAIANQNYSPEVMCSTFRIGLFNMLNNIHSQNEYTYEHVIFDMPPNPDGYSDAVLDCTLNSDYSIMDEEDLCNLFIMQTLDMGQRQASIEYFLDLITRENSLKINKIFFVFNDFLDFKSCDSPTKEVKKDFETAILQIQNRTDSVPNSEAWKNKIYFVALNFYPRYFRLCTTTDGIINGDEKDKILDGPEEILNPVKYLHDYNGECESSTDKLFKLMCNEGEST